jgi:hypothetical protein
LECFVCSARVFNARPTNKPHKHTHTQHNKPSSTKQRKHKHNQSNHPKKIDKHETNKKVPREAFQLPALGGLEICVTNFAAAERRRLQELAARGGARFTPEMYKESCTHLVCLHGAGAKHRCVCVFCVLRLLGCVV